MKELRERKAEYQTMNTKPIFPLFSTYTEESKKKMQKNPAQEHTRINDILLGPLERPALQWLAAHMPAWVQSDHLTLFGLFACILVFVSYILTRYNPAFLWLASLGFILNWFGDSLDGTLARYRHTERPLYGFYIDHILDMVSEALVFIGIGLSPYVSFNLAMTALVMYQLLSNLVFILMITRGFFQISFGKLGPTEIRVIGILANVIVFFAGNPFISLPVIGPYPLYDIIVAFIAAVMLIIFVIASIKNAVELSKIDLPKKGSRKKTVAK
jgi:phosphatidylglycerophosphate synthase